MVSRIVSAGDKKRANTTGADSAQVAMESIEVLSSEISDQNLESIRPIDSLHTFLMIDGNVVRDGSVGYVYPEDHIKGLISRKVPAIKTISYLDYPFNIAVGVRLNMGSTSNPTYVDGTIRLDFKLAPRGPQDILWYLEERFSEVVPSSNPLRKHKRVSGAVIQEMVMEAIRDDVRHAAECCAGMTDLDRIQNEIATAINRSAFFTQRHLEVTYAALRVDPEAMPRAGQPKSAARGPSPPSAECGGFNSKRSKNL